MVPSALLRDLGGLTALSGSAAVALLALVERQASRGRRLLQLLPLCLVMFVVIIQKAVGLGTDDVARLFAAEDLRAILKWQDSVRTATGAFATALPSDLLSARNEPRRIEFEASSSRYRVELWYFGGPVGCSLVDTVDPFSEELNQGFIRCDPPRPYLRGGYLTAAAMVVSILTLMPLSRRRSTGDYPR